MPAEAADDAHEPGSPGAGDEVEGAEPPAPDARDARRVRERRWWADDLLLSSELAALAAFAFSRPVLDTFGHSPASFVLRGVTGWWVVAFGLIVVAVPALAAATVGAGARRLGGRFSGEVHAVLVGLIGGVGAWRVGQEMTGWPGDATKLLLGGVLAGLLLVAARHRLPQTRTFLRIAGAAPVVYLVLFLVASPASTLIAEALPTAPSAEVPDIGDQLGDDPPDVMVLVFDELPVESLLDGTGHIDGDLYPNFAALAGDATWYRNHTTVAGFTYDAVPALLTGRYPDGTGSFTSPDDPENLFTLLAGSYEVHGGEHVTTLCPESVCESDQVGLGPLLSDAVGYWRRGVAGGGGFASAVLSASAEEAGDRVDELDLRPGRRPHLVVHHVALPHQPWQLDADGTVYQASTPASGLHFTGWSGWGHVVGRQRHVLQLQATDRLLGRYLDTLRDAGTYDDTLVAVTADHGVAFGEQGTPLRGLSRENYDQIMWTPLLIKEPGQRAGAVDDSDVRSIDLLPTLAGLLGVEVPWPVDGEAIGTAERDGTTKPYIRREHDAWRAADGEPLVEVDARAGFARVLAADPVRWEGEDAVWKRTAYGDLLGRDVEELDVGEPVAEPIALSHLGLDDVHPDEPLPIEVAGRTSLPGGTVVAFALNGTVGAVGETIALPAGGAGGHDAQRIAALLLPRLIVAGDNDLEAFVVEGPVGAEVLRPVQLT